MPMFNLSHSHATFHGGTYTQVNNVQQQTPWDRLQSAAAPSAFHDSGDNFDAPKCHPNTRVAVMNELRDFTLRRGDTGNAKILWLNGPAGAGKSAIARSLCEECASRNSLLASFFFNRSDPSRNNHKTVVATIVYQVFGYLPPQNQSLILGVIERDPLVFTRSVGAQFEALIVRPLHDLFENGYFSTPRRCLIVIDGLDECSTASAQINILAMIQNISTTVNFPFIFLVASRPENEIQAFFRSSSLESSLHQLNLNDTYLPHVDIERFLRDKFQETRSTHALKNSISRTWPSDSDLQTLVRKSSGLFIYASIVVKYIASNRHFPPDRLDTVLELRPLKGDLPFAELDKLYSHVFSCVEDIDLALHIISYRLPEMGHDVSVEDIARINQLTTDSCILALCDLWSILGIETVYSKQCIVVFHQSIWDYLFDTKRSGRYHLNKDQALIKIATQCLQYISGIKYTAESRDTRYRVIEFFRHNVDWFIDNIELSHEAFMSFSLIQCYGTFSSLETQSKAENRLLNNIFGEEFLLRLLDCLCTLSGASYSYIYQHYLNEYRQLTDQHPHVYLLNLHKLNPIDLVTVLILSEEPGRQMPSKVMESAVISLLNNPSSRFHLDFKMHAEFSGLGNLFCCAALQCFEFLKHNSNANSVAVTLRYLTWVLPWAIRSSVLDAECSALDISALNSTGDYVSSTLVQEVVAATQDYRHYYSKWYHQYLSFKLDFHEASES